MRGLFNQMIKRPADALVSSIEMLGQSIQGSQRIDAIASRIAHTLSRASGRGRKRRTRALAAQHRDPESTPLASQEEKILTEVEFSGSPDSGGDHKAHRSLVAVEKNEADLAESTDEEKRFLDIDLRDDTLKLVQYRVLFVKRDYEVAFPEKEELIADGIDEATFTSWKIAEFMQSLGNGEMEVPGKWRDKNFPSGEAIKEDKLVALQEEDKKYLRIYYEVLDRFPRRRLGFMGKQISRLEDIRDALQQEPGQVPD